MLKIGVVGTGHLGRIHIDLLSASGKFELVGAYDADSDKGRAVCEQYGIQQFQGIDDLIDSVDAVDIVTPTLSHYDLASRAIKSSRHVFIEKPVTNSIEEARTLLRLTEEAGIKAQVGHVERFNPVYTAALPYFDHPMFIETHRLAEFNPRGTDVSVVLDLMIHDIDMVLSVVDSTVRRISASGVEVLSETPDIANARIEFDNGCVANLTASRISMKQMRKSRFFQKNAYLSLDLLNHNAEIVRMKEVQEEPDPFALTMEPPNGGPTKQVLFDSPPIETNNPIGDELSSFADSILNNGIPPVPMEDGYRAIDIAHQVLDKLKVTSSLIEKK